MAVRASCCRIEAANLVGQPPQSPSRAEVKDTFRLAFANAVISMYLATNLFSLLTASAARKFSIGVGRNTRSPGANSGSLVGVRQGVPARQWPCAAARGYQHRNAGAQATPAQLWRGPVARRVAERRRGGRLRRSAVSVVAAPARRCVGSLLRHTPVQCDWLEKLTAPAISPIGFIGVWRNELRATSSRSSTA